MLKVDVTLTKKYAGAADWVGPDDAAEAIRLAVLIAEGSWATHGFPMGVGGARKAARQIARVLAERPMTERQPGKATEEE